MRYINVEQNVRLAVDDINPCGKKTIVFIHGWPLSSKIFEYQINLLPYYGYRIVAIDLRGFGRSDATACGYSYDDFAKDIYKVIRCLNLTRFVLVGFSMGGAIAIRYMTLYKGYGVTKLALLGAAAPSFVQRECYPYGMTAEEVDKLIVEAYEDRPKMVEEFGKLFFNLPHSDAIKEWFKLIGYQASSFGTIESAISLKEEDLRGELPLIQVETGIFHGKKDKVCPYEFALIMKKNIKRSKLFTFEKSGHGVFYDELELFNQEFFKFID